MKKYTFLAHVLNKPGVLNKVAMIVRRKLFNIDTLTVSPTRNTHISAMTMVFKADSAEHADQVLKQLGKVVEVLNIEQLEPANSIQEDLMLLKMLPKTDTKLKQFFANLFYRVVHKSNAFIIVEVCATKEELDLLLTTIPAEEILEISRTGVTSLKL